MHNYREWYLELIEPQYKAYDYEKLLYQKIEIEPKSIITQSSPKLKILA